MKLKQMGFTIIELMVAVSVVGVFAAFAVPSFQATIQNAQITSSTNNLVGVFYYARSESIKLSQEVQVCKSDDGATCDNTLDWQDGWIAWTDTNGDGAIDTDEILRVGEGMEGEVEVIPSADVVDSVQFSTQGLASLSGTWTLCDSRGADFAKAVLISPSGRVRSSTADHLGGALVCP